MKVLYLDCGMGAAGDMLMAALLELHPDPDAMVEKLNQLAIPTVKFARQPAEKCGIVGTHVSVTVGDAEEESLDCHHDHGHHDHHHDHDHEHHHDHPHHEHGHVHDHDHDHGEHEHHHGHHHDHDHEHDHPHHEHDRDHPHDHPHDHHHEHGDHDHPHHGDHHHGSMDEIAHILHHLDISDTVRNHVLAVYDRIAQAESLAHGVPVSMVHFHEVGAMDAIADIVGCALLMEELAFDRVVASPIHVGSGHVRCAHGVLPVPAPATATILQGAPIYSGTVRGELCTPTGAALLMHFVHEFGAMPPISVSKIGYGMGSKDFEMANCLRAMAGEIHQQTQSDQVLELVCNLDDMTGEAVAFAMDILLDAGALDVFTAPITMKKGRPATMLTCLCRPEQEEGMAQLMLRHTTSLGVRISPCRRRILQRTVETVDSPFGPVRVKKSTGDGVTKTKVEYEDVATIARQENLTIAQVLDSIQLP